MSALSPDALNYHHLRYFWTAVREGGVSRAAEKLRLSQPTISAQIKTLEDNLGERLLDRGGRGVRLTEAGRIAFRYADEIFSAGRDLLNAVGAHPSSSRPMPLRIGIADALPKLMVYRLLRPALSHPERTFLTCREDKPERLIAELALHELDVVLTDTPVTPQVRARVFNHLLGDSGVTFFAPRVLAARVRRRFPLSLTDAPMLLPTGNTALRRALDRWFDHHHLRPRVIAEFEDSALLKVFGEAEQALFPVPTAIADEVRRRYRVTVAGATEEVRERYYAISAERRLKHPAVIALTASAREDVFA